MKISVDVVIPSFRLEEKYIVPLLTLSRPADAIINFYVIVDNPVIKPASNILTLVNQEDVFLLINPENLGAAETRNVGINAGRGNWILFLDDDIVAGRNLLEIYVEAIKQHSDETGFLGSIQFPEPAKNFTKAIKASGSMDIFSVAERTQSFAWGATANTMVRRSAISEIRFSQLYPKAGGGEDVDFFLKVRKKNHYKNFRSLPAAIVYHPWWKHENIDFGRSFRYGKGNSYLGELNPDYTYYDFLNTPETLLIAVLAFIPACFLSATTCIFFLKFITGILLIEIIATTFQTKKRYRQANLQVIFFVMLLRLVQECGVLAGKLSRGKFWKIGERFHDDGKINKVYFYRTNSYKILKWILYPILILLFLYKYI